MANKHMTAEQVAELLGLNVRRVYRWAERGKIPGAKVIDFGGSRQRCFMFDAEKVRKFSKQFMEGDNEANE